MEDENMFNVAFVAMCKTEEDAARVVEALSRPMAGLILDGIAVMIMRQDPDQ